MINCFINIFLYFSSNKNIWSKTTPNFGKRSYSTSVDEALYTKLLEKRAVLAKKENCSRFMIATDAALRQMANLKPRFVKHFTKNICK